MATSLTPAALAETLQVLDTVTNQLVPVAGLLMQLACEQEREHSSACTCRLCRAFLAVQDSQNKLEALERKLKEQANGQ